MVIPAAEPAEEALSGGEESIWRMAGHDAPTGWIRIARPVSYKKEDDEGSDIDGGVDRISGAWIRAVTNGCGDLNMEG